MEGKGAAYFADWDAQIAAIANEDIRERSMERKKEVEENFADLRKDYTEARDAFQPMMNDLKDIRTALSADLTMQGLDSVKKSVSKVNGLAEDVKENLEELSASFRELGVRLSKSGPPPTTPPK
jgi:methyl-accepting chemotaxis protein